jgi:hypothetical protein
VVAKSVGLIGVIEQNQPPASGWRLSAAGDDGQFGVCALDRAEVICDLFLEGGDDWDDLGIGQNGALVDD